MRLDKGKTSFSMTYSPRDLYLQLSTCNLTKKQNKEVDNIISKRRTGIRTRQLGTSAMWRFYVYICHIPLLY